MEEQLKALHQQLLQKDETITVMKVKTREFIQNLKDEHLVALHNMESALSKASEVIHNNIFRLLMGAFRLRLSSHKYSKIANALHNSLIKMLNCRN